MTSSSRPPAYRFAVLLMVAVGPTVWFVRMLNDVPALIVVAAAIPALLFAWLVVQIDRLHPEPLLAKLGAVAAGAVLAAWLSHTVNAWLLDWAGTLTSADQARPLAGGFGAPVVEEIAKALALVLLVGFGWHLLDDTLDGIVYGALVGIGFAFTENVVYLTFAMLQGGEDGLLRAVCVRALLGGGNHAAFTATTGAALGWALHAPRPGGRWLVPLIGLALATLQHVVWNAVAASAIQGVLCGPELAGGPCRPAPTDVSLFVTVPILTAIFLGPAVVTLGAIAALSSRAEKII